MAIFVLCNIKLRKRILPRLQYLQTDVLLYSQGPEFQKYFFLFSSERKHLDFSNININKKITALEKIHTHTLHYKRILYLMKKTHHY